MKEIVLIEPVTDGLKTIKSYLSEINAHYSVFNSVDDAIQSDVTADLVVLLANQNAINFNRDIDVLNKSQSFSKIPRIFILPLEMAGDTLLPKIISNQPAFKPPIDKLGFLSTAARLLKIPPRRVFRTLITIEPEGSNIRYSGVSVDFSKTGMAFECAADLAVGSGLTVNFVDPKNRKRFSLRAGIGRKAPIQSELTTFYGVKFINIEDQDIKDLMDFITGKNS